MSQDGSKSGHDFDGLPVGVVRSELDRDEDGNESFHEIEKQTGDANLFPEGAEDICGTDVPGSVFADIDPLKFTKDEAEGNRPKEEAE